MHISDIAYYRLKNSHIDLDKVTLGDVHHLRSCIMHHLRTFRNPTPHPDSWIQSQAVLGGPRLSEGNIRIGVDISDPRRNASAPIHYKRDAIAIEISWNPSMSVPGEHEEGDTELLLAGWADLINIKPYALGLIDWVDHLETKQGVSP